MVERLACIISGAPFPSKRSLARARAVIEALLEPTPEMVKAMKSSVTGWPRSETVLTIYRSALRTALSKPNDEGEGK